MKYHGLQVSITSSKIALFCIKSYKLYYILYNTNKYQKTTQKRTKAFERFLRILQLCRSRFRLINLEANFKALELKRYYLELNQAYKRNIKDRKSFHQKVWNIKNCWKQKKCHMYVWIMYGLCMYVRMYACMYVYNIYIYVYLQTGYESWDDPSSLHY